MLYDRATSLAAVIGLPFMKVRNQPQTQPSITRLKPIETPGISRYTKLWERSTVQYWISDSDNERMPLMTSPKTLTSLARVVKQNFAPPASHEAHCPGSICTGAEIPKAPLKHVNSSRNEVLAQ